MIGVKHRYQPHFAVSAPVTIASGLCVGMAQSNAEYEKTQCC